MAVHHLKSWPEFFKAIANGDKTFDLRRDDRNYAVDDHVTFEEFRPGVGEYTGVTATRRIAYVLRDFEGLMPGYCILGLAS
jgi:ParB family chromosome partitioning protein